MKKTLSFLFLLTLMIWTSITAFAFTDLSKNHQNYDAINYLKESGIINGYEDGTFKPSNTVNRAELLKILVEGLGIKPELASYNSCFSDVSTDWYAPYVCYAKSVGWVDGYEDGTFKPGQAVNKAEAIKMLINSQEITLPKIILEDPYNDVKKDEWFTPYIRKAKDLKILEEEGNFYQPGAEMTRAGISENLYRLLLIQKESEEIAKEEPLAEEEIAEIIPASIDDIEIEILKTVFPYEAKITIKGQVPRTCDVLAPITMEKEGTDFNVKIDLQVNTEECENTERAFQRVLYPNIAGLSAGEYAVIINEEYTETFELEIDNSLTI